VTPSPTGPDSATFGDSFAAASGESLASAYGETFAAVYDDWYAGVTDVASTVETLLRLSGGGNLLELGVGTGRIAIPLAQRLSGPAHIVGVDASSAMLDRMAEKVADLSDSVRDRIVMHRGDMKNPVPGGPFSVIFCTFNTFFNLPDRAAQIECLHSAAMSLTPGGAIVLETAVFHDDPTHDPTHDEHHDPIHETRIRPDGGTVRSTSRITSEHTAEGEFSDDRGNVWPWRICFASPAHIDRMALEAAGLVCTDRWEDFTRRPFVPSSSRQVCVLRRRL
jgi:ubiquinone/menaquinone biosynthesis C-methylase UbiE